MKKIYISFNTNKQNTMLQDNNNVRKWLKIEKKFNDELHKWK